MMKSSASMTTSQLIATSPGPFNVDAYAISKNKCVEYFNLEIYKIWTLTSIITKLQFSPNGKYLLATCSFCEKFIIFSLESEKNLVAEFTEPLCGSGLINSFWVFEDWIITFADYGLHISLWNIHDENETPDRITKPKRSMEDLNRYIVAFLLLKENQRIAVAHDDDYYAEDRNMTNISIFTTTPPEKKSSRERWKCHSKWKCDRYVEEIVWIDSDRLLLRKDLLLGNGQISIHNSIDGTCLFELPTRMSHILIEPTNKMKIICWNRYEKLGSFLLSFEDTSSNGIKVKALIQQEFIIQKVKFNSIGSRIACQVAIPNCLIRKQINASSSERVLIKEKLIDFSWDPIYLRNRILFTTSNHLVCLWESDGSVKILHRFQSSPRKLCWNAIGSLVGITFDVMPSPVWIQV